MKKTIPALNLDDCTDNSLPAAPGALAQWVFKYRKSLPLGVVLATLAALVADTHMGAAPSLLSVGIGAALLIGGLFIRFWASLYMAGNRDRKLVRGGPYSLVRNPLYFGNFAGGLGAFTMTGSLLATGVFIGGMAFIYYFTIAYEDARLERRFGDAFVNFRREVPRMLPRYRALCDLLDQPNTDSISYANLGRELRRATFALVAVALLLLLGWALRALGV